MAVPFASSSSNAASQEPRGGRWPYLVGGGLTALFLADAWFGAVSNPVLRIIAIIVSFGMVLIVPGTFLVGLALPDDVTLSPLGFLGLSFLASLMLNLLVGYVLSTYHLLSRQPIFIGIGGLSAALVVTTRLVKGYRFRACRWPMLGSLSRPLRDWPRLVVMALAMGTFVTAVIVSTISDRTVYPSVYLTNSKGQLAGYPVQLLQGHQQRLTLFVNNQGGTDGIFAIREIDNGRPVWSDQQRIRRDSSWRHMVSLPAASLGMNDVVFLVKRTTGSSIRLHVSYRVQL